MSRYREQVRASQTGRFSLDIITGAQNMSTLSPQDLFSREHPEDISAAIKLAKDWHRDNWLIEALTATNTSFYNYGFKVQARSKRDQKKVKAWTEKTANRARLGRFVDSVWEEWHKCDNLVAFWREKNRVTPFLLPAENCTYTDAMGLEVLKVKLNYSENELKVAGMNSDDARRYSTREIVLDEVRDEYFRVLTRGLRGKGLGVPRLHGCFRTLSQCESMEVGESMLAYGGRLVLRLHKMGFEVKSGSNATKQAEYLWKRSRADAIEGFFKGRQGFAETTAQFDHNISYVWVDPKHYDARKWETIANRLIWWGGPVAFMMMAKGVSPFLLPIFKARVQRERERVGPFLEEIIDGGFDIGAPVRVSWSNRCFTDTRLAWDMVKALMQQGPLSLTTALQEADFDPEQEAERKSAEAAASRDEELLPKFDPNHGQRPGQPPERAGRKTGVGDKEKGMSGESVS